MSESTPLLHQDDVHGNEVTPGKLDRQSTSGTLSVVLLCTLCILTIDVGIFLQMAPLTRILESIVCRSYYQELGQFIGGIPESECKLSAIQGRLAMLKGWSALSDCLPSKPRKEFVNCLLTVPRCLSGCAIRVDGRQIWQKTSTLSSYYWSCVE